MSYSSSVKRLNEELSAAGVGLADNTEVLRGVLAGCGDCIKILDLDGRLQFMSEGGKRVMEVDDFAPLKGCEWPSFWAGDGHRQAAEAVAAAKAGGTGRFRGPANTAKGTPRYWDVQVSPIMGPDNKPAHLLSISRDITEEWEATERLRFLTEELQHRVKNTLTTVLAIAGQTFRGEAHQIPLLAFNTRVTTLNRVHDMLTETHWTRTPVRSVVEGALSPHSVGESRFRISGPDMDLEPKQGMALALAVNELATNALKYGALSSPSGQVRISWDRDARGTPPTFRFVWQESGGPAVARPARQGFGSRVINQLLADDFGGAVETTYDPAGLRCVLTAPINTSAG